MSAVDTERVTIDTSIDDGGMSVSDGGLTVLSKSNAANTGRKNVGIIGDAVSKHVMSVNIDMMQEIIRQLTDLYSNPIEATIRETVSNAIDATILARKNGVDAPNVDISVPSHMSPTFIVEDHGVGMTPEQAYANFADYGNSTKTTDMDVTGSKGLGAKAPLAYTTTCVVSTVRDGHKIVLTLNRGEYANEAETIFDGDAAPGEGNGTRVEVPVRNEDVSMFSDIINRYRVSASPSVPLSIDGKDVSKSFDETMLFLTRFPIARDADGDVVYGKLYANGTAGARYYDKYSDADDYNDYNLSEAFNSWVKLILEYSTYDLDNESRKSARPLPDDVMIYLSDNDGSGSESALFDTIEESCSFTINGWGYNLDNGAARTFMVELPPGVVDFPASRDEIRRNDRYSAMLKSVASTLGILREGKYDGIFKDRDEDAINVIMQSSSVVSALLMKNALLDSISLWDNVPISDRISILKDRRALFNSNEIMFVLPALSTIWPDEVKMFEVERNDARRLKSVIKMSVRDGRYGGRSYVDVSLGRTVVKKTLSEYLSESLTDDTTILPTVEYDKTIIPQGISAPSAFIMYSDFSATESDVGNERRYVDDYAAFDDPSMDTIASIIDDDTSVCRKIINDYYDDQDNENSTRRISTKKIVFSNNMYDEAISRAGLTVGERARMSISDAIMTNSKLKTNALNVSDKAALTVSNDDVSYRDIIGIPMDNALAPWMTYDKLICNDDPMYIVQVNGPFRGKDVSYLRKWAIWMNDKKNSPTSSVFFFVIEDDDDTDEDSAAIEQSLRKVINEAWDEYKKSNPYHKLDEDDALIKWSGIHNIKDIRADINAVPTVNHHVDSRNATIESVIDDRVDDPIENRITRLIWGSSPALVTPSSDASAASSPVSLLAGVSLSVGSDTGDNTVNNDGDGNSDDLYKTTSDWLGEEQISELISENALFVIYKSSSKSNTDDMDSIIGYDTKMAPDKGGRMRAFILIRYMMPWLSEHPGMADKRKIVMMDIAKNSSGENQLSSCLRPFNATADIDGSDDSNGDGDEPIVLMVGSMPIMYSQCKAMSRAIIIGRNDNEAFLNDKGIKLESWLSSVIFSHPDMWRRTVISMLSDPMVIQESRNEDRSVRYLRAYRNAVECGYRRHAVVNADRDTDSGDDAGSKGERKIEDKGLTCLATIMRRMAQSLNLQDEDKRVKSLSTILDSTSDSNVAAAVLGAQHYLRLADILERECKIMWTGHYEGSGTPDYEFFKKIFDETMSWFTIPVPSSHDYSFESVSWAMNGGAMKSIIMDAVMEWLAPFEAIAWHDAVIDVDSWGSRWSEKHGTVADIIPSTGKNTITGRNGTIVDSANERA